MADVNTPSGATNVSLVTTTPTTVLTMNAPDGSYPNALIYSNMNITMGAGTTSLQVKCFDNTGTQVGTTRTITVTAGNTNNFSVSFRDTRGFIPPATGYVNSVTGTPGGISRPSYTVQVTQVAATGNGTVNEAVGFVMGTN